MGKASAKAKSGNFVKKVIKKPASSWVAKRGVTRVIKRPSRAREQRVNFAYTRSSLKPTGFRRDRAVPQRSMMDFFEAKGTRVILRTLRRDGLIKPIYKTDTCPQCGGKLGRDEYDQYSELPSYRCTSRNCRKRLGAMSQHPFFVSEGDKGCSPAMQMWMLMNFLCKVPCFATHYQTGLHHNTIERFNEKVRQHIKDYVIARQEDIVLNDSTSWVDIEVDEVTISKFHTKSKTKPVAWIQYLGIVRRGHPESLILVPMPVRHTGLRAPGPGPLLLKVWEKISKQYITKNKRLIIHTDAARAYRKPIAGTLHTAIVHQMKKIDGVWVKPQFTRREDLELPDGTVLTVRPVPNSWMGFGVSSNARSRTVGATQAQTLSISWLGSCNGATGIRPRTSTLLFLRRCLGASIRLG